MTKSTPAGGPLFFGGPGFVSMSPESRRSAFNQAMKSIGSETVFTTRHDITPFHAQIPLHFPPRSCLTIIALVILHLYFK